MDRARYVLVRRRVKGGRGRDGEAGAGGDMAGVDRAGRGLVWRRGPGGGQPHAQGWWKASVVGAFKVDAAEIWTEGVASTSNAWNGLEPRAGVAMPEVTDLSATDWNACTREGTPIVAW